MNFFGFGSSKSKDNEISEEEQKKIAADHARNQRLKKLGSNNPTE
jgi:hypothetical protein